MWSVFFGLCLFTGFITGMVMLGKVVGFLIRISEPSWEEQEKQYQKRERDRVEAWKKYYEHQAFLKNNNIKE